MTRPKKVRIGTLRKGTAFTCASGNHYTYEREDGASAGVHHVVGRDGTRTMFAGCADVTLGWSEVGWMFSEAAQ